MFLFQFTEDVKETHPELLGRSFTILLQESPLRKWWVDVNLEGIDAIYDRIIDKNEYAEFADWLRDMRRSGLLIVTQNE